MQSSYVVLRPLLGHVGLDRLGGGEVGVRAGAVALLPLDDAAAPERAGELRVDGERLVVVAERRIKIVELEIDQRAAVDRVGGVGLEAERLVAVVERAAEVGADNGARPAA